MRTVTLNNGIPLHIEKMNGTNVVTALILFGVGSRNESKRTNGISHFLEHLFFKGTSNRPTTLDISRELDGVGASFNAFTSKDYTGYYVKVAAEHAELAIDVLHDLLLNPLFDPEEVDRERGVIIEEINMYKDKPDVMADELVEGLVFGVTHPLGYGIAGPIENIQKVSRSTILKYRDTYYRSDNMHIVLAGNVPSSATKWVKKRFEQMDKARGAIPKQKAFSFSQKRIRAVVHHKPTAQAHIALAFPGPDHRSKKKAALAVLSTVLGSSMSSRLFINVRERKGLCYYIRSHISSYSDAGVFTIQAGFDKSRVHDAIQAIAQELRVLREDGITEEELDQAKRYLRGKMSIRMEDSEDVASWWAHQALFQSSPKAVDEYLKAIDGVTAAQVKRAARDTFKKELANLAVVGPFKSTSTSSFIDDINL